MSELITCLMATYNRYPKDGWLLEEAVQCFRDQDYPNKELLILNDTPGQELVLDKPDPQVHIINFPQRFQCLGYKFQYGIAAAKGSLFCMWDDDDLNLPHRLTWSMRILGDSLAWFPTNALYRDGCYPAQEVIGPGNTQAMGIWRREAIEKIGGFPIFPKVSWDQDILAAMRHKDICKESKLDRSEHYYVYRWGTNSWHLSGVRDVNQSYKEIAAMPVEKGVFAIESVEMDYDAINHGRTLQCHKSLTP